MFRRGKPRILATLAALLGMSVSTIGCQGPPVSYGPDLGDTSTASAAGQGGQNRAPGDKQGAQGTQAGSSYLPTPIQQSGFQPDAAKDKSPLPPPPPQPGAAAMATAAPPMNPGPIPREINMVSLPPYQVAPPDILVIDAARLVPKPPYKVEPLEVLLVQVTDTLPNQPISGPFVVSPEGTINLGYGYGTVRVQGQTVDQIIAAIRLQLANVLRNPQVAVSLGQFRGQQQVRGEHLVRPDGTISLGTYGSIYVAGLTLEQVRFKVEEHLKNYVINPQVAVDVYGYNSQFYYVIFDGGGFGQQIYRLPITGNETVLYAISSLQGLPPVSSQWRIWVARPAPSGNPCDQILMVDWQAVVKGGSTCTNYQLFPGDRVYVDADCLVKLDLTLAKILAPVERILGITLLGTSVYNSIKYPQSGGIGGQ